MSTSHPRSLGLIASMLLSVALSACASAGRASAPVLSAREQSDRAAMARASADSARLPYTEADVTFMAGMIGHHGQAIEISNLVPSRSTHGGVRVLAERIINAQQDEIALMQQWLRDRRRPAPVPQPTSAMGAMAGMQHEGMAGLSHGMMPGMLSLAQVKQLEAAKGTEFDELFLTYMIQHHRGAVTMVKTLFATHGAGQDELVFKFASDVNVDQSTEIARMEQMLAALKMQK